MNQLQVISFNGQLVTDSRDVAEMVGKQHDQLMRSIRTYIDYMDSAKLQSANFFIPHTYHNSQNKEMPCFLLTRKGCDMVANKMTGERGVLFTAAYVTRFEEMSNQLNQPSYMIVDPVKRAEKWIEEQKEKEQIQTKSLMLEQRVNELQPKATYYDLILQNKSLISISVIAKDYGMGPKTMNKKLHDLGVQYNQGGIWLLYAKYQDKGYTQTYLHAVDAEKSKPHTKWTQAGRIFIYELLKREGIVPMIEREYGEAE